MITGETVALVPCKAANSRAHSTTAAVSGSVIAGGVIPPKDVPALEAAGVAAVFGPGTAIPEAAREVLRQIRARRA
jgi:methylmalonyl-CoA mutase cobalamin-binding domain/chain